MVCFQVTEKILKLLLRRFGSQRGVGWRRLKPMVLSIAVWHSWSTTILLCAMKGRPRITGAHKDGAISVCTAFEVHKLQGLYKDNLTHSVNVRAHFTPFSGITSSTGIGSWSLHHLKPREVMKLSLIKTVCVSWSISALNVIRNSLVFPSIVQCQYRCGNVNSARSLGDAFSTPLFRGRTEVVRLMLPEESLLLSPSMTLMH